MEYEIYNPHNKPLEELPTIFGFNNGGSDDWWSAALLASDGEGMGGHICSHEGFMPGDLGCLKGSRPDRHEGFRAHFPDGYKMEFVPGNKPFEHAGIAAAYELHKQKYPQVVAEPVT